MRKPLGQSPAFRALLLLSLAAFLLCLAPLLYLGRYDVPCADDYNYGASVRLVLAHGGSARDVLRALVTRVVDTWHGWQGSYSAIALMCLQPAVFSEKLYAVTPWIMCASLYGGLFCFCACLLGRVFGLPRRVGVITAALLGVLSLLLVPFPVETLYWYNGSVYYTFFHGLALFALALGIRTAREGGAGRILGLSLLGFFLGGGNLVTGLTLALLGPSALALLWLLKKPVEARRLLLPCLLFLLGFALNILAPGNAQRQLSFEGYTPEAIPAILRSFRFAAEYGLRWLRLPVLGVLLVLGQLFWASLPASSFRFRFPGLVSLWSFCLFAAMFCPTSYATGGLGAMRVTDIIYYAWLLLLALNLFYWLGWLSRRRPARREAALRPVPLFASLVLCVALLGVSAVLHGGISVASALTTLRTGEARAYYETAQERFAILNDPTVTVAELPGYASPPYLLFFDDLSEDIYDWRNTGVAVFYEKEAVLLRKD